MGIVYEFYGCVASGLQRATGTPLKIERGGQDRVSGEQQEWKEPRQEPSSSSPEGAAGSPQRPQQQRYQRQRYAEQHAFGHSLDVLPSAAGIELPVVAPKVRIHEGEEAILQGVVIRTRVARVERLSQQVTQVKARKVVRVVEGLSVGGVLRVDMGAVCGAQDACFVPPVHVPRR